MPTSGRAGAWGRFEADEPDTRFRALAGSGWRRPTLNPSAKTYDAQVRVGRAQDDLIVDGVVDEATMTFTRDRVFENWTTATRVISGKGQYSGAYHWQHLDGDATMDAGQSSR
jgi:hypothetical protein